MSEQDDKTTEDSWASLPPEIRLLLETRGYTPDNLQIISANDAADVMRQVLNVTPGLKAKLLLGGSQRLSSFLHNATTLAESITVALSSYPNPEEITFLGLEGMRRVTSCLFDALAEFYQQIGDLPTDTGNEFTDREHARANEEKRDCVANLRVMQAEFLDRTKPIEVPDNAPVH